MDLHPDYSWVPDELGSFIGGIQAICVILTVIALTVGVVRFVFAKVTSTRLDDAIGDRILVSVLVGSFVIAGLGQLVGQEMNVWSSTTVTAASGENASLPSDMFKQETAHDKTAESAKNTGDSIAEAGKKIAEGDFAGAAAKAWDAMKSAGATLTSAPQAFVEDIMNNGLNGIGKWFSAITGHD
ncbi:hypothetical protein [Alloscardovia criceti]|uniref:hypothetical protein n=1 Tax=Alloscardovia criceti TaxID=356828 RepID=UPI0003722CEF|nr:hypothetical protein [Alloscardovia criceti]